MFTAKFKIFNFFKLVKVPGEMFPMLFLLTSNTSNDVNCEFSNF